MGSHHQMNPFQHHPYVVIWGDLPWSSVGPCMHTSYSMHTLTCMQSNHVLTGSSCTSLYMAHDSMSKPGVQSHHAPTIGWGLPGVQRGP